MKLCTANNSIQAGNLIDLGTGGIADATGPHQIFTTLAGSVAMTQLGGGTSNLQALNATLDAAGGALPVNLGQSLTVNGTFSMAQHAVTDSGQFGNYAGTTYK